MSVQQVPRPTAAYAERDDLTHLGLSARALLGVEDETQDRALDAASGLADSYLGTRYRVPLLLWQDDLRVNVAQIAAWYVIRARGFDPTSPHDQALRAGFDDAIEWLQRIANGEAVLTPPITEQPDTGPVVGAIAIIQTPVF